MYCLPRLPCPQSSLRPPLRSPYEVPMNSVARNAALVVACVLLGAAAAPRAPESIVANDNRRPAGTLKNGVLAVKLEARNGMWRPEGENGRALPVAAWAEEGKP